MIIDAHAHIFSKIDGKKGLDNTSPQKYGKVLTGNIVSQMLPPFLADSSFRAEMLINIMDYAKVDKAVLVQNPVYGIINNEISEAIRCFPDRFIGTIQVDPMCENAIEIIKRYVAPKQSILKLELSQEWGWSGIHPGIKIDNPQFVAIWELASDLELQVIIDPGKINNPGYQVALFDKIFSRYPKIKFLLEHMGYLTSDLADSIKAKQRWLDLIKLAKKDNVFLGFSAFCSLLDDDYPCISSLNFLREAVSIVGSEKILWGSDVPVTLKKYTYEQMINVIDKYATFLTINEKEKILGANALNFFKNW
ncbi:MAG: amidohydrolase family protein [Proteiniphilum sp.]